MIVLVRGVGYKGVGKFKASSNHKEYRLWSNMLTRCYYPPYQERFPTYVGCSVDPKWHNFQDFAEWASKQSGYHNNWVLDKDILVKGNKTYSQDTCCFVPSQINSLITYKTVPNKTEPVGVSFQVSSQKYIVSCAVQGRNKNLGRYLDLEEAHKVYKDFKLKLIRDYAYKYQDELNTNVFQALINYEL